jgi:hypothetical protein
MTTRSRRATDLMAAVLGVNQTTNTAERIGPMMRDARDKAHVEM